MAVSVNHPLWVLMYVEYILPYLVDVGEWPADYMPGCLAAYLGAHRVLLEKHKMWESRAARFVQLHL